MPNRIIREGFLDSEAVAELSPAAECLFFRLLLAADDAGRFDGRAKIIASRCDPIGSRRPRDVESQLRECEEQGLLRRYEVDGKPFLQLMKWQRCGKAERSKYPAPDASHKIDYVERDTRDGVKSFAAWSLPDADAMPPPSSPHGDGIGEDDDRSQYEDEDEDEDGGADEGEESGAPTRPDPPPGDGPAGNCAPGASDSASGLSPPPEDSPPSRAAAMVRWQSATGPLIGLDNGSRHPSGSPQHNADRTSIDRMFDRLWPEGADAGEAWPRLREALELAPQARRNGKVPMAWLTDRVGGIVGDKPKRKRKRPAKKKGAKKRG